MSGVLRLPSDRKKSRKADKAKNRDDELFFADDVGQDSVSIVIEPASRENQINDLTVLPPNADDTNFKGDQSSTKLIDGQKASVADEIEMQVVKEDIFEESQRTDRELNKDEKAADAIDSRVNNRRAVLDIDKIEKELDIGDYFL